jgi:hypothetical protein
MHAGLMVSQPAVLNSSGCSFPGVSSPLRQFGYFFIFHSFDEGIYFAV